MKRFLLLFLVVLCASSMWAQCSTTNYSNGFTCIRSTGNWTGTSALSITATFGVTPAAGHGVMAVVSACYDNSCGGTAGNLSGMSLTMTNSAGDTLVPSPNTPMRQSTSPNFRFMMGAYWFPNISAVTQYTINCSGGSGAGGACFYLTLYISEWTGGSTSTSSPWDVDSGANLAAGNSTGTPSIALSSATSNATDLIFGWINGFSGSAYTPGTAPLAFQEVGEQLTGEETEAISVAATGNYSCNWTSTAQVYNGICLALKAGGGAPPPVTMVPRHRGTIIR